MLSLHCCWTCNCLCWKRPWCWCCQWRERTQYWCWCYCLCWYWLRRRSQEDCICRLIFLPKVYAHSCNLLQLLGPILVLMSILVLMPILVLMLIVLRMLILLLMPILVLMLMLILVAGEVEEVASAPRFSAAKLLPILALDQPLIYKLIMQCCIKETKGNLNWRTLSAP